MNGHDKSDSLSKRPLRWGICGSGNIASDFVNALQSFPKDQHVVHAVGDMERFKESAVKFGAEFGIPTVYSSFEALGDDPLVDVAYVGVVNTMHFPVASLLLRKKKNVVVEKPLSCCSRLVEELVSLAKENDVFFMEVCTNTAVHSYELHFYLPTLSHVEIPSSCVTHQLQYL